MSDNEIELHYCNILRFVFEQNFKNAFDELTILLAVLQKSDWLNSKTELENNYKYMLMYALKGTTDKDQKKIYDSLRLSLLLLADKAMNALCTRYSNKYAYSKKRELIKTKFPENIETIKGLTVSNETRYLDDLLKDSNISISSNNESTEVKSHQEYVYLLFCRLWLKAFYGEKEVLLIEELLTSSEILEDDKCVAISAVSIGLLQLFDEKKFELLISTADIEKGAVQIRALVGLLLCLSIYKDRIQLYEGLVDKLDKLFKNTFVCRLIPYICRQYCLCLDTEKVNAEIQNEILPELLKENSYLNSSFNELLKGNEKNADGKPEWKDDKLDDEISDKIDRFGKLQKEGADVFMNTFATMKNYPFFGYISNWFLPFNYEHPIVKSLFNSAENKTLVNIININPLICNSDRYSLLFSISSIPDNYKQLLGDSLDEQLAQVKELNVLDIKSESGSSRLEIQQYCQDLYRFFKLFRDHSSFVDVFKTDLKIYDSIFFKRITGYDNLAADLSKFFLKKKKYEDAYMLYKSINKEDSNNIDLLEKLGFCCQKMKKFSEAISYYEKALLVSSTEKWLLNMTGICYLNLNNYSKALSYFKSIDNKDGDEDFSVLLHIGQCYIGESLYNEALNVLYKIEFYNPNNLQVHRLISWCAFLIKKFEVAYNYSLKISDSEKTDEDIIKLGYIEWCLGKREDAASHFVAASQKIKTDKASVIDRLLKDIHYLYENGITNNDFMLMLDQVRYLL